MCIIYNLTRIVIKNKLYETSLGNVNKRGSRKRYGISGTSFITFLSHNLTCFQCNTTITNFLHWSNITYNMSNLSTNIGRDIRETRDKSVEWRVRAR